MDDKVVILTGTPILTELQEFIIENPNTWEEKLSEHPYSLKISHKDKFVLFKYNQIESDFALAICREARGLILEAGTWRIVRAAFKKFFNIEEPHAATIDWASAVATLKLDGSLVSLWWDGEDWRWSTNGTIDAKDAPLDNGGFKTFQDLIDFVLESYPIDYDKLNTNYTYTMELCSRANKIVIDYPTPILYHTLTVDNRTLKEVDTDIGLPKPAVYICESKKDYQNLVAAFGQDKEGIVVKDKNCNRVKIKTPLYFELHKQINNGKVSVESALQLILDNDQEEFLSYFEEQRPFFEKVETAYIERNFKIIDVLVEVAEWRHNNMFATRKDFAAWVKKKDRDFNYYFLAYDGNLEKKMTEVGNDAKKIIKFLKMEDCV